MTGSQRRALQTVAVGLALIAAGGLGLWLRTQSFAALGATPLPPPPVGAAFVRADAYRAARVLFGRPVLALYVEPGRPATPTARQGAPAGANGASSTGYTLHPANVLLVLGSGGRAFVAAQEAVLPSTGTGQPPQRLGWMVLGLAAAGVRQTTLAALPGGDRAQATAWARRQGVVTGTVAVWPFPDGALLTGRTAAGVQFAYFSRVAGRETLIPSTFG